MSELDVRPHGKYKALDWLWLGIFYYGAALVARTWWKKYRRTFHTVSVFTRTIYSPPDGLAEPGDRVYRHEQVHVEQRDRMGLWKFVWKYITRRGRVELEVEAYKRDGRGLQSTTAVLTVSNYLLWGWSDERVAGVIYDRWKELDVVSEHDS